MQKLVLENQQGKVVRVFACNGDSGHLIYRQDQKRLTLVDDLNFLRAAHVPFLEVATVSFAQLKQQALSLGEQGFLRAVDQVKDTLIDSRNEGLAHSRLIPSTALAMLLIFSFVGSLLEAPGERVPIEEELKQHVVKIVKKVTPPKPKKAPPKQVKVQEAPKKKVVKKAKAVKRLGALAVLGKMGKRTGAKRAGGVNLGAMKTSPGPGLGGGKGGSGGMQTSLYGKGLVAAPVGAGANIKGGGGYGTKGKGGGQDGYGQTSLIGSVGTATVPVGHEAIIQGGLDPDVIAQVIQRNMGQVRFCYEQGLQSNPKLAGRVAVDFVIGGTGRVKTARLKSTTLKSQVVEDCILLRLKTWKFPLPEGGVDVKVAYPFLLRRLGSG